MLETNERYSRQRFSVDLDVYQCQLLVDSGWANEYDEETPDVNEYQVTNIKYDSELIFWIVILQAEKKKNIFRFLLKTKNLNLIQQRTRLILSPN